MKKVFIGIFLILGIGAKAQDKQIVTMNNGSVEEVGYITPDGLKDSIWVRYNEAGVIVGKASFSKGQKHGVWETYNNQGIKLIEIVYEANCKKFGKRWDESGNLIETREY